MCGISGYAGIQDFNTRYTLVRELGEGIDYRGGHAAGFVSLTDRLTMNKKAGTWESARARFVQQAASGDICMMHARYATCGDAEAVDQAHPYAIKRDGKTLLWGAHNGIIYNARESAARHKREYTVDSKELFELLADGHIDQINRLEGYGVITWIEPDARQVNLVRLTSDSEIVVAKIKTGGAVWASTWTILAAALKAAGLESEHTYKLDEIGRVYMVTSDGVYFNETRSGIKLESRKWVAWSYTGWDDEEEREPESLTWEREMYEDLIDAAIESGDEEALADLQDELDDIIERNSSTSSTPYYGRSFSDYRTDQSNAEAYIRGERLLTEREDRIKKKVEWLQMLEATTAEVRDLHEDCECDECLGGPFTQQVLE